MTDIQLLTAGAMFCLVLMGALSYAVISRQQRTIDVLTSKLMAKDYREYTTAQKVADSGKEPRTKQLSWYDDPQVEKEDDA